MQPARIEEEAEARILLPFHSASVRSAGKVHSRFIGFFVRVFLRFSVCTPRDLLTVVVRIAVFVDFRRVYEEVDRILSREKCLRGRTARNDSHYYLVPFSVYSYPFELLTRSFLRFEIYRIVGRMIQGVETMASGPDQPNHFPRS